MSGILLRRVTALKAMVNCHSFSLSSSKAPELLLGCDEGDSITNYTDRLHLSPLSSVSEKQNETCVKDCGIQLVDDETWQVSSGIAAMWRGNDERKALESLPSSSDDHRGMLNCVDLTKESPGIDEIEDMRIRGSLFYKLETDSKEYDEYNFEFRGKKRFNLSNHKDQKENKNHEDKKDTRGSQVERTLKKNELEEITKNVVRQVERFHGTDKTELKEIKKNELEILQRIDKNEHLISHIHKRGQYFVEKLPRSPTFNQLTAPYHEPFCLDIYISKGSVSASIIHRVTSKVVAVAHSISKDMKFNLSSTKNRSACASVGELLAQRALADDIHNVVYTPRKREKIEGKLQIVLRSIIDNGIDVKVKLKQTKSRKTRTLAVKG